MRILTLLATGLLGIAALSIVVNPKAKTAQVAGAFGNAYGNAVRASEGTFAARG